MELNRSCKPPRCLNFTAWNDETTRLLLYMWKILSATLSFFSSCLGGFGPNVFCCQKKNKSEKWKHKLVTTKAHDLNILHGGYFRLCLPSSSCLAPPINPHLTIPSCWPQAIQQSSPRVGSPSPLCPLEMEVLFANHKVGEFISSSTCSGHWV